MKRRILFALLLTFISFTALNAEDWSDELECIPYEPPGGFQSLPASALEGPHKVLVIAATTTGDIERGWSNLAMPVWLRDSFIAPDPASINAGQYKWSISNFWAGASHGVYQVFGDVNPGNNGNLFVSDHDIGSYPTEGDYIKHILEKADAVIDYSQYDYDHDGYVDYIFFLLPRAPDRDEPPDQPQIPWWACPPACAGLSGIRMYDLLLLDNTYVTGTGYSCGTTCYRWQDTLGLYRDKIPGKWYDIPNFSLHGQVGMASHEMGHNRLVLKDYYDRSCAVYYPDLKITKVNRFAVNNEMGWYSIMNLTGQPHASMFSASELAEHAPSSWVNVLEVDENSQNFLLYDMLSSNGQILKLNVGPAEYFLLSAHMQSSPYSHWEELMGGRDNSTPPQPRASKGVLVWHICHRSGYMYSSSYSYELAASYDLECAEGKWALFEPTGPNGIGGFLGYYPPYENSGPVNPDNPQPELGFDRLNLTTGLRWEDPSFGYGMYTNPHDFFGTWTEAYVGAFTSMTNPSSDAYNDATVFYYTFPANDQGQYGIYDWPEVVEPAVYQNLASHVGLEGMHQGGTDYMQLCIRRSRIWTDEEYSMDRTTQRKLLYDPYRDIFHFIYPSKGYIYYTQSYDPAMRWYTADLLGHGIWPAIALDSNNRAMAVWFDSSQVMYNYHDNDQDWHYRIDSAAVLSISGAPGPVAMDYGFGDGVVANPGGTAGRVPPGGGGGGGLGLGTVHLAYITRVNGQDQLRYARFLEMAPEDLAEETLDVNLTEDSTRIIGASIEVDNTNNKVSIAYGCVKGDTAACFYYERTTSGWQGPYRFPLSISTSSGEPLVPYVDIDSILTRVVFNANEGIYFSAKLRTSAYNAWATPTSVTQMPSLNRYPQIAGNMISWSNYPMPDSVSDSSNVYGLVWPGGATIRLDSAYGGKSNYCQVTKTTSGTACMYQHGTFYHPEPCWAIYYRGPDGFGGNQENDGSGQLLIPKPEEFTMAVQGNVIRSNQFSVLTSGGDCELAVYDITGRKVTKLEIKDVPKAVQITTAMDCSDWSKGIYFVRAIPKEGPVRTAKVVRIR